MKRGAIEVLALALTLAATSITWMAGCKVNAADAAAEAPPVVKAVDDVDVANRAVQDPSKYPLAAAEEYDEPAKFMVTGVVSPDIARTVPVISMAIVRVVGIKARLGDEVKKFTRGRTIS